MPMVHKEETIQVLIRLPKDVKDWIEKEAARTLASQNSEILRCIRQRMDSEPKKAAG
ncbi:Arc family DNA-binding protein [Bradyrhizobium sp. Ash2021]|uniref:Arc family DNA-binding protein n=1 Tax=Bradyrhizobium sp. Ash2021 TaxID=2954771 RepID=UPI002814CE95|nr:Arc family DNA-binding protein [Bradyrhizobium sp. Ash2021]WMT77446.1 Arc family DNA-binding protein [Bradyrhizobium sp. Ash2021]